MKINEILGTLEGVSTNEAVEEVEETLEEGAVRQVRRYGNKMKMQYRCQGGEKDGKLVSKPSECGIRKNPGRVRAGQKSARIKKGQRVRKTAFTKKKTLSQILVRRNKALKNAAGQKDKNLRKDNPDTVKATGTKGSE